MTARQKAVPGDAEQLPALYQFLKEFWSDAALAPAQLPAFELALEEIFVNIVTHGSQPGITQRVEVSLTEGADGVTMTIEDDGPPFDPLSVPPPDVTASAANRRPGGLGIFLVRQMMDTLSYARVVGRNQLRMRKRLAGSARSAV